MCVKDTPFSTSVEDKLVWMPEKNNCYSVGSAYCLGMENILDNTQLRHLGNWSGNWKLKVPQKSRIWCGECVEGASLLV